MCGQRGRGYCGDGGDGGGISHHDVMFLYLAVSSSLAGEEVKRFGYSVQYLLLQSCALQRERLESTRSTIRRRSGRYERSSKKMLVL